MLGLNFGICVPNSCTPEMIKHVLQTVQSIIPKDKVIVSLVPDTCQMVKDIGWNIDAGDIICLYGIQIIIDSPNNTIYLFIFSFPFEPHTYIEFSCS